MNRLHGYGLSEHDLKLEELNKWVVENPDPEKRNLFSVLQSHAILLSRITIALEETVNNNAVKVEDHEKRIKAHDDIVLQGKLVLKIMSSLQGAALGLLIYGWVQVAGMRDKVNDHSLLLPRIDAITTEFMQQRRTIDATSDHVQQQAESISNQNEKIDDIGGDVTAIKRKKVFKASR